MGECFFQKLLGEKNPEKTSNTVDVCIKCFASLIPEKPECIVSVEELQSFIFESSTPLQTVLCKCRTKSFPGFNIYMSSKYIKILGEMHHEAIEGRKVEAEEVIKEKIQGLEEMLQETSREVWKKKTDTIPYNIEHKFTVWEERWKIQKEARSRDIKLRIESTRDNVNIEYNIN
jgi:hypothetical protein